MKNARLTIEANGDVPEDVIAVLASSYWEDEVRYAGDWEEDDDLPEFDPRPGGPQA